MFYKNYIICCLSESCNEMRNMSKYFAKAIVLIGLIFSASGSTIALENRLAGTGSTIAPENSLAGTGSLIAPENRLAGTGSMIVPENRLAGAGSTIAPENNLSCAGSLIDPIAPESNLSHGNLSHGSLSHGSLSHGSLDSLTSSLSFIRDSLCYINDPDNSLSSFKNELYDLLDGKDTVINVVHLGDSHVQAGYLSGRTMRLLHHSFGNAGRGWIAPFKLSRANEPADYYILSNVKDWIAGRCIQVTPKCPWGIGGIGIQTKARDIDFRLIITPNNGAGYSFNKVLLFRDVKSIPMSPVDLDDSLPVIYLQGDQPHETVLIDTFIANGQVDTFALRSVKTQPQSGSNLYYGLMLMNGNPGILYHSIGVNGARYTDYTHREYIRQLSLLQPSLLIISLGTNESFGRNFNRESFEMQVGSLVSLVREEMPGTSLLITTPIETYRSVYVNKKRQYVRNENIAKVADVIASYTEKEGIACLDMYAVGGGANSCKNWYDAKMFGRDRIHFTRNAYEEQGALLYKAIVRSCLLPEIELPDDETLEGLPSDDEEVEIENDGESEGERSDNGMTIKEETDHVE